MPDVHLLVLTNWCTVWQRQDTKTRYGQARVSSPENMKCRWTVRDADSVGQDSTTEFYPRSVMVAKQVALGSYVARGKIADLPTSPQYFEVVGIDEISDVKGRHTSYRLTLQKASKTLPEVI